MLPTAAGKIIIAASVIKQTVEEAKRVLFLAHREELLTQAQDKIYKVTGLNSVLEKGDNTAIGSDEKVVVGSVQTLMRANRLNQYSSDYFDLIIVDEAHHNKNIEYSKSKGIYYFRLYIGGYNDLVDFEISDFAIELLKF